MRRFRLPSVIAASILLAACSYKPTFINEYKIDVQQGNVLTQEMVAQLKPGQTRDQVRFLLGSPMITDIFHQDRWDYVYYYRKGKTGEVESRQFQVFFNREGKLERVAGAVEVGDLAELSAPQSRTRIIDFGTISDEAAAQPAPAPETEKPGFFRRMMNWVGL